MNFMNGLKISAALSILLVVSGACKTEKKILPGEIIKLMPGIWAAVPTNSKGPRLDADGCGTVRYGAGIVMTVETDNTMKVVLMVGKNRRSWRISHALQGGESGRQFRLMPSGMDGNKSKESIPTIVLSATRGVKNAVWSLPGEKPTSYGPVPCFRKTTFAEALRSLPAYSIKVSEYNTAGRSSRGCHDSYLTSTVSVGHGNPRKAESTTLFHRESPEHWTYSIKEVLVVDDEGGMKLRLSGHTEDINERVNGILTIRKKGRFREWTFPTKRRITTRVVKCLDEVPP